LNSPKVSVIIPCYNHAHFLRESVGSVITQTYENWECIIVNDGSTDNTEEVAKALCEKDARIRYVHKENGGLSSARNKGLESATGDYIQLLDADDIILKEKFQYQIGSLLTNDADVSVCDYSQMRMEGDKFIETPYTSPFFNDEPVRDTIVRWEAGLCIPCHAVIFKRSFFADDKICFNTSLPTHEDWAFWVEMFMTNAKVVSTNRVLCYYINRTKSMSMNKHLMRVGYLKAADYLIQKVKKNKEQQQLLPLLQYKVKLIKIKYAKHNKFGFYQIKKKTLNRLRLLLSGYTFKAVVKTRN
jgi:glycosyltransferase involved in cell wall biosynthesis